MRFLIAIVMVFVAASAMAATQSPRVSPVPAPHVWPDRVRLVGTGTVVYSGKRPITTDQWCPIRPRTAVVPIDPEQSVLDLILRASGSAVLVSALVNAAREPEITTGIATCSRSAWGHSVAVFQTLPNAQSVIGEEGTTASLVAGEPFPTARAETAVRMDASSPTLTSAWTLSPVAD